MKKTVLILLCVLLCAALLGACGTEPATEPSDTGEPTAPTEATRSAALAAYRDILKAAPALEGEHPELQDAAFDYDQNAEKFGKHYDRFAVIDIDKDGVPELLAQTVVNFRWTPVSVFAYQNGAAALLKDPSEPEAHGTFEMQSTANGAYTLYICADGHLHSAWSGTDADNHPQMSNSAFSVKDGALTPVNCALGETGNAVTFESVAKDNTPENADMVE